MPNYSLPLVFSTHAQNVRKHIALYFCMFVIGVLILAGLLFSATLQQVAIISDGGFTIGEWRRWSFVIILFACTLTYVGYRHFQYFSDIYKKRSHALSLNEKGIGCYLTDWILIWDNIENLHFNRSNNILHISLSFPVVVIDKFKGKIRSKNVSVDIQYLGISTEAAMELVIFIQELQVKYQRLPGGLAKKPTY